MIRVIQKIDKIITKINELYLILSFAVMFILVFGNVIGRYFFSFSYVWVDELSRYLMISIAFLGMGLAMRQGSIAAFNILQNALPNPLQKVVRILVLVFIFSFMAILCYQGLFYALRNMGNRTEALRWNAGMWYLMIPIGSILFMWHMLFVSKQYIFKSREVDADEKDNGDKNK